MSPHMTSGLDWAVPCTLSLPFPAFVASTSGESHLHLYYTFDDARVIVRALWGARRERGPRI